MSFIFSGLSRLGASNAESEEWVVPVLGITCDLVDVLKKFNVSLDGTDKYVTLIETIEVEDDSNVISI